jgi:hypothetical protein
MAAETPIPQAHISECELILHEITQEEVQQHIELLFGDIEKQWGDIGSPFQRWYRTVTSLSSNGRNRHIAWKKDKLFVPEHLFFRTIDSRRLLPMHLAPIRVQFYAHKSHWRHLEGVEKGEMWKDITLSSMVS